MLTLRWAQCSSTTSWDPLALMPADVTSCWLGWHITADVRPVSSLSELVSCDATERRLTADISAAMLSCSPCGQRRRRSPIACWIGVRHEWRQKWKMQRISAIAFAIIPTTAAASAGGVDRRLVASTAPGQHRTAV